VDTLVVLSLAIGLMFGAAWVQFVGIPRWRRRRAQRYLDIMDDPMTNRVQTGVRTETQRYGRNTKTIVHAYATARIDAPWGDLTCTLLRASDPRDPDALIIVDPHELHKMACTVGDPTAHETLAADRTLQRTLHSFLARSSSHTITAGEVRVELLNSECDAMVLAGMQSDVADILHALGPPLDPS
jgi:hypothetical protein